MPGSSESVDLDYVDSDLIIHWLEGKNKQVLEPLFDQANKGLARLTTSVITIGEVVYVQSEKDERMRDPEVLAKIDALWHPDWIPTVEVNAFIMMQVRELRWRAIEQGMAVPKIGDAVHMMSAKYVGARQILTYNLKDFKLWENVLGIPVREPTVPQPSLPYSDQQGMTS